MNNYFWDTHAHVFDEYFDNKEEIINNAFNNNTKKIINSAVDKKTMIEVIETSKAFDNVYCTLGIHPEYADKALEEDLLFLEENISNNKVVAVGEIGLDYYHTTEFKEEQKVLFEKQLAIAEKHFLPVVIHSRDATKDTIDILKKYKVRGVIHSFTGSYETANEYINLGFLLGINGVVTFKNCNMKDYLRKIDLKNIVLETDCPYLAPVPYRGKENNPGNIDVIANFLTSIYGCSKDKIAEITSENASSIFDK
ncbi:MAG: TatD family hydrolase [bacterium]